MLRFIHIPKTGGTSLRSTCEKYFGRRFVIRDYPREKDQNALLREPSESAISLLERKKAKIIVGHRVYRDYEGIIPPENTIVFFRHPVQREISSYFFDRWRRKIKDDLITHATKNQNILSRYVEGLPLEQAAIGITERFYDSILRLNKRFDLLLDYERKNENLRYKDEIPQELKDEIARLNDKDLNLYNAVRDIFDRSDY